MSTEADPALAGGSYEVIRERLLATAKALSERAEALNARRRQEFGGQELSVLGSDRVRTENNCVPRDAVPVGPFLLLGFNVFMGLKQERAVSDVFSLHRCERGEDGAFDFSEVPKSEAGGFLEDRRFVKDFEDLFKFYKDARLNQLIKTEARLLAIFRTGLTERDVKVLRFGVDVSGRVTYLDNRGEGDWAAPPTHDFEWRRAGHEEYVTGRHPHVNILDEVFIETLGGDLTVKVENNTETGQGIYAEPVEEASQSLDDAEFHYAKVGALILLKVLPFREKAYRYLVFNTRTRRVVRADAIGQSCVTLPEEQGITFPGGYVLQTGEAKLFDQDTREFVFHRALKSPNGEDVLFLFFARESGAYVLFPYNLVRKQVANPLHAHGYATFPDGRLVLLNAQGSEPSRVHPVQVWQTPFVSAEHAAAAPAPRTALGKLGNAELVRGISEVLTLRRLAESDSPTRRGYEALIAACTRTVDQFHWLGHAEVGLLPQVLELKKSAELIIDEFEKVLVMRRQAAEELTRASTSQAELLQQASPGGLTSTGDFMAALGALRKQLGQLITLQEVRYVDLARVEAMEAEVKTAFDEVSQSCVQFLLTPAAFAPLHQGVKEVDARCQAVGKTTELAPLVEEVERLSQGLSLLGEIVGGLEAGDPTQKAKILEDISEVFAGLNRVRATVLAKRKELLGSEKRAEFGSQFKLFAQSIDAALSLADSPEKCDEQLTRLTLQLEELESRFSDFDEFAADLTARREDLLEAFGKRKQLLVDERQRRAQQLFDAGERILQSVARRSAGFAAEDELNSYFAADPMLQKLKQLVAQLLELKDSVKADELDSRLKTAKQDALRGLRDRKDLFEGGQAVVRLGSYRFNVNTQPLDATVIPRDEGLFLHLTGSDYAQRLADPDIDSARAYWAQTLPSESPEVYRAEYLAASILRAAEAGQGGLSVAKLHEAGRGPQGLWALTRDWAQARYDDGLERGVHDADAAAILQHLVALREDSGLLRFPAWPRALGTLFWAGWRDEAQKTAWHRRALSSGRLRARYASRTGLDAVAGEVLPALRAFAEASRFEVTASELAVAARYLSEELAEAPLRFVVSRHAVALRDDLLSTLEAAGQRLVFEDDLRALDADIAARFRLVRAWLEAHSEGAGDRTEVFTRSVAEAAALLAVDEAALSREVSSAVLEVQVKGLLGQHPRIQGQTLSLRLDEFEQRMTWFVEERTPAFQRYRTKVRGLLDTERGRLRLDELKPKVLSSFVRNRLIDEVYLPLIGANLAKQLGVAGDTKRTDRMGLLLLVSPPGYGKTTLMEYVAARLGLTFVKVNGPALGHEVVSVDPGEAPNATARQEVERINFAFELGNNVMLYLDDIQHTNPELLQKFISLCDATRRVEGVWNGRSRTYDLRGKKFCVVMAGNPYTEAGERFRIPDMLANRADTYNLGDILGGKQELFASSYLENALTSNPVTAPLLARPSGDLRRILDMAAGATVSANELEHGYSAAELTEIVEILKRFLYVQRTLLKVNQEYIKSASQDDRFRTEPPFKLQGSYRNMNKLAEKIVAAMTDAELEALVDAHYASESQTLTTAAEANLLKLAELRGRQAPEQKARWEELKRGFKRVQVQGGADDDPVVRVTGSIASLGEELGQLKDVVLEAAKKPLPPPPAPEPLGPRLEKLTEAVMLGAKAPRPSDVGPKLDAIAQVLGQVGRALVQPPAPRDELGPSLERMTQALAAIANRPVASAALPDLTPVLERLAAQVPAPAESGLREDVAHQMMLIQERLQELAANARAALQGDPDGAVKATLVWQHAKEAIELLKALPSRSRKAKSR
ncbi:MAG: DNA repair ATPase [Myxococcales bacterium]|nr:DNA repair ATPase [Myxococcales bacterium]